MHLSGGTDRSGGLGTECVHAGLLCTLYGAAAPIFDTMLSFAARVLGGEMPDDDAATQWAFEQIYSFVVPNVREELLISSGSTPA